MTKLVNIAMLFPLVGACSSSKADDVQAAREKAVETYRDTDHKRDQLTVDQQKAQAELDRKQAEEKAELERKQADERASQQTARNADVAIAEHKLDDANAKMVETRKQVEAKVAERLDKLDAQTRELEQRAQHANDSAKANVKEALAQVEAKRTEVQGAMKELRSSTDVTLAKWETAAGKKLDELQVSLSSLDSKLK